MSNSKEQAPKSSSGFEKKMNKNGKSNPKYVDLLEEDKPVAGQKFVCVSFVSPEKIVKQKELFFFEQFLQKWEFSKSMEKFVQFLSFISFKYKLTFFSGRWRLSAGHTGLANAMVDNIENVVSYKEPE